MSMSKEFPEEHVEQSTMPLQKEASTATNADHSDEEQHTSIEKSEERCPQSNSASETVTPESTISKPAEPTYSAASTLKLTRELSIQFQEKLSMPSCKKACRLTSEDWFSKDELKELDSAIDLSNILPHEVFDGGGPSGCEDDIVCNTALSSFDDLNDLTSPSEGDVSHAAADNQEAVRFSSLKEDTTCINLPLSVPSSTSTCIPNDKDVLLGRGGMTNKHPGNKRYRAEVERLKPWYSECETKAKKKEVSQLLVDYIHHYGGRFLSKDPKTKQWVLADPKAARKKTSQALREAKWKPNQTEELEKAD